ncbi:hypothetical protein LSM04_004646 [Trypanosoma melophagium]|uniref:uncharacterized protein n=1 Tax=Trypanosoma melophagium TaxID=715481 RepID=UPI003519F76A|nr:hypothetical protein LSM04_004646 [Trypanosoma melophagium]
MDELNQQRVANEQLAEELVEKVAQNDALQQEAKDSVDRFGGRCRELEDRAAEMEEVAAENMDVVEGELADVLVQLKALEGENAALAALLSSRYAEIADLKAHDERWAAPVRGNDQVTTQHVKVFDGDEWDVVVKEKPEALRQAFVTDAAAACHVDAEAIGQPTFALGSLHVDFAVTHDADITKEEIDRRLAEFPFRNVMALYGKRHREKDGLDKALEELQQLRDAAEAMSSANENLARDLAQKEAENEKLAEDLAAMEQSNNAAMDRLNDLEARLAAAEAEVQKEHDRGERIRTTTRDMMDAMKEEYAKDMDDVRAGYEAKLVAQEAELAAHRAQREARQLQRLSDQDLGHSANLQLPRSLPENTTDPEAILREPIYSVTLEELNTEQGSREREAG